MQNPIYLATQVIINILDKMDNVIIAYNAYSINDVSQNISLLDLIQIGFISTIFKMIFDTIMNRKGE